MDRIAGGEARAGREAALPACDALRGHAAVVATERHAGTARDLVEIIDQVRDGLDRQIGTLGIEVPGGPEDHPVTRAPEPLDERREHRGLDPGHRLGLERRPGEEGPERQNHLEEPLALAADVLRLATPGAHAGLCVEIGAQVDHRAFLAAETEERLGIPDHPLEPGMVPDGIGPDEEE